MSDVLEQEIASGVPTCRRGEGFADNLTVTDGVLRGRAVPYGHTVRLAANTFERFAQGAFAKQTKDPSRVKVCLDHGQVVGRVTELEERSDGLWFEGRIAVNPAIPETAKARAMIDDGLADELSVGFVTVPGGTEFERADGAVTYRHTRARLLEISLTPWGVYGREATLSRSLLVEVEDPALVAARLWVAQYRARRG